MENNGAVPHAHVMRDAYELQDEYRKKRQIGKRVRNATWRTYAALTEDEYGLADDYDRLRLHRSGPEPA